MLHSHELFTLWLGDLLQEKRDILELRRDWMAEWPDESVKKLLQFFVDRGLHRWSWHNDAIQAHLTVNVDNTVSHFIPKYYVLYVYRDQRGDLISTSR